MDLPCKQKLNSQQIIFLNGTTTAGKSSIVQHLEKLLKAQSLSVEILSIDTFVIPKVQWLLFKNRISPANIFVANEDLLQYSDMKRIKKESMKELCAAAVIAYKQNNIVIIDAPIYESKQVNFYNKAFENLGISNISKVLVYCPITTLVKRVIERNQKSSMIEQRSIAQALDQFRYFYQSHRYNPIDQLSREEFDAMWQEAETQHIATQETIPGFLKGIQNAICPYSFGVIKSLMLDGLFFNADGIASIKPIIAHDFIVNTGQYDSAVCAQMIFRRFAKKLTVDDCF